MKLLITGAGGQLGKEWVDFCLEKQISFKGFNSSELDIVNAQLVESKVLDFKPDVIINCAAYTKVDNAEEDHKKAEEINGTAVENLAKICTKYGIKLVHFSTDYVFSGEEKDRTKFTNGYPEEHERAPINEYGYSKFIGEQAIQRSDCDYLLIRVSWLCGKYGNNFVKTMIRLSNEKDELNVVNDQFGSPSFTFKVVEDVYQLLSNNRSGIYHSTSEGLITWYDLATEIFKQKNIDINVDPVSSEQFKTQAKRPAFSKLDTEKISKIDGIKLIDWKEGLKIMLEQLS
jgi:dTDP-4-dehydrorhamnose reductase